MSESTPSPAVSSGVEALVRAVAVMDQLRSPGGCPWDAEQTHESLARYLLEETYETLDAISADDRGLLREELGDLLLQVLFHARIAEEEPEPFGIGDVAGDLVAKLVRRHPHVFADTTVTSAEQVNANWDAIKQVEKQRDSVTDGIALAQPALSLAAKLVTRSTRAGMTVPAPVPETAEASGDLGERLFALVQQAVADGHDPEVALRRTAMRYREQILQAEHQG